MEQAHALARQNLTAFRVTKVVGASQSVSMDYIMGRVNAHVDRGIVVGFRIEGTSLELSLSAIEVPTTENSTVVENLVSKLEDKTTDVSDLLRLVSVTDWNVKTHSFDKSDSKPNRVSPPAALSAVQISSPSRLVTTRSTEIWLNAFVAETSCHWQFLDLFTDAKSNRSRSAYGLLPVPLDSVHSISAWL